MMCSCLSNGNTSVMGVFERYGFDAFKGLFTVTDD
jgi:hypothetical protein